MWDQLLAFLRSNQFASGGLLAIIFGSTLVYCKQFYYFVYNAVIRRFTIQITVMSGSNRFAHIAFWLYTNPKIKKCKDILLKDGYGKTDRGINIPNYGSHLFWIKWKPYLVRITREKEGQYGATDVISISTFGWSVQPLIHLIDKARDSFETYNSEKTTIYVPDYEHWDECGKRPISKLTPILANNIFDNLFNDIQKFKDSEQQYCDYNIPYKRGYLLSGPPGNGKTSTVLSLAQKMGYNIAILCLSDKSLTDNKVISLIKHLPEKTILVFEDIDCLDMIHERTDEDGKDERIAGPTLGSLLNVLDGFYTPHNFLFFATTNHKEKLDEALVRKGRFDVQCEIEKPTVKEIQMILERFNRTEDPSKYVGLSMCEIVELIR